MKWAEKLGVELTASSSFTPEINKIAKGMDRLLMDNVRAMMKNARLSDQY